MLNIKNEDEEESENNASDVAVMGSAEPPASRRGGRSSRNLHTHRNTWNQIAESPSASLSSLLSLLSPPQF